MNTNIDTSALISGKTDKVMRRSITLSNILKDIEGIELEIRDKISDAVASGDEDNDIDDLLRQLVHACFNAGELSEIIKNEIN